MEQLDYQSTFAKEAAAFRRAVVADPTALIFGEDGWTNEDLAKHLGKVWGLARANLASPGPERAKSDVAPPSDMGELEAWLSTQQTALLDTFSSVAPDTEVWTFSQHDNTATFWLRRVTHETSIHRWDAEHASGTPSPLDPVMAADGIDEYSTVTLAGVGIRGRNYPDCSVHLHCTDIEGEWTFFGDGTPNLRVTREHVKGDAAVRGSAESLLLWVWGRAENESVDVFGDAEAAEAWRTLSP